MSSLPEKIRDKFIENLLKNEEFQEESAENLRKLMQQGTRLKPKDVEAAFISKDDAVQ